jgi:O-antigen ligase
LRLITGALEALLALIVTGSVAALASVRPEAYVTLWFACAAGVALLFVRARAVHALRALIGPQPFSFHPSGRWLVIRGEPSYGLKSWSFDLGTPAWPRGPFLRPGLAFMALVAIQLLPLGPGFRPLTLSAATTARGLCFVAALVGLHAAAAAAFVSREARERFRAVVAGTGAVAALVALVQIATGTTKLFGLFEPLEGSGVVFGPFVNRNHFAGYMLLCLPTSMALLVHSARRYDRRAGERANLRRRLVALGAGEGTDLLYASVPPFACAAGLLASTSRGALLALGASLLAIALVRRHRRRALAAALAVAVLSMSAGFYALERIELRAARTVADAPGRTLVWQDALRHMNGRWLLGSGFGTFAWAVSRAEPFRLPALATPWPEPLASGPDGAFPGVRVPESLPGTTWYREAHNDYLQVLIETGIPGLLLVFWAAGGALRAARRDTWLLVALLALMLHEAVDFDLQIPAIAVLFVCLAATRRASPA